MPHTPTAAREPITLESMEVIVTHTNTDFDAFASMLATRRLYPGAVIAFTGSLNRNVRDFYMLHAEELDISEHARIEPDAVSRLIVVETVHAERLGDFESVARSADVELAVFDHHEGDYPDWAPRESVVLSEDGALTTTMVSILAEREIAVSPLEATAFALGIHEDTGSLAFPTATLRDAEALAWCIRHGARQEMISHYLRAPLGDRERTLLDALLGAIETYDAEGFEVLVTAIEWTEYVDGVSNLAQKVVDLTDARALVVLVEMADRVLCVVRTRIPELDASEIAGVLGGGGHRQAASAIHQESLADARDRVLAAFPGAVGRHLTALDIMSKPPRFVGASDTVAHALVLCQRHRQSGVHVGEPDALIGIVAREDLDKAVAHGLSHAPVKSVMSPDPATCSSATPIAELQRLLARLDAGRLPVVEDGRVIGVVTRGDLLRALEVPVEPADDPASVDLGERLITLPNLEQLFEAIQAVGEQFEGVYLVGGAVRDVIAGEAHFDVDVAVEGDGITFGQKLAQALGGRVVPHEKFGTAVVVHGQGERVDVATTRTEFYDSPAALPAVEQATIRQDLYRRDFTLNAMAVSLRGEHFGRLVDPFGGLGDLEHGVLRVLHNLSFIDDPTRIFRAIRYENRFGFRMDGHTLGLARACVEMDLVGELSSARLRDELQALFDEENVGDSILRLAELGIDRSVHPHLAADEEAVSLVECTDHLRVQYAPRLPRWRLRLAVLSRRLPPDELYEWFGRLLLRRRDADRIADAVTVARRLGEILETTEEPAGIRSVVEPHDPDGALLALALVDGLAKKRLELYFDELRNVELEISGGDVRKLGIEESPRIGEILSQLLRRKLNGELDGRTAELQAARELIEA